MKEKKDLTDEEEKEIKFYTEKFVRDWKLELFISGSLGSLNFIAFYLIWHK